MGRNIPKLGTVYKRKATNAAKQFVYMAIWHEEPPKQYKKDGSNKKRRSKNER